VPALREYGRGHNYDNRIVEPDGNGSSAPISTAGSATPSSDVPAVLPSTCERARWRVGVCRAICQMPHSVHLSTPTASSAVRTRTNVSLTAIALRPATISRGHPAASAAAPPCPSGPCSIRGHCIGAVRRPATGDLFVGQALSSDDAELVQEFWIGLAAAATIPVAPTISGRLTVVVTESYLDVSVVSWPAS
jgi:hypothetical protein